MRGFSERARARKEARARDLYAPESGPDPYNQIAKQKKRLEQELSEIAKTPDVVVSVQLSGGYSTTWTVDQLLDHVNSRRERIESIRLVAGDDEYGRHEYFSLQLEDDSGPIRMHANGTKSQLDDTMRTIRDILDGAKPLWSVASNIFVVAIPTGLLSVCLGIILMPPSQATLPVVFLLAALLTIVVTPWARRKILPNVTFAIGQGRVRHKQMAWVRRVALGGAIGVAGTVWSEFTEANDRLVQVRRQAVR